MKTQTNWSDPSKLAIVSEEIQKSPDNLRRAFENIASRIGGISTHAVSQAWYGSLKSKFSQFQTQSSKVIVSNVKNNPRARTNAQPIHETILSSKSYDGMKVVTVRQYFAI
jgi:hypothetical protein